MTGEEIEQTLQRVAVAIEQLTQVAVRADERQDAADLAQQVTTAWRRDADERLDALINAQVRYEARQERLEEAFHQVAASHQMLVELASIHEERIDGQDEADVQTESRIDALIDAQIQLTHRVDTLTTDIASVNGRTAATDERLDRMSERMEAHDRQFGRIGETIEALVSAQARTDEQIRSLLDRNGSTARPKARKKPAKKTGKKGSAK